MIPEESHDTEKGLRNTLGYRDTQNFERYYIQDLNVIRTFLQPIKRF